MHPCERARNVQSVTWRAELRLDADGPDSGRQAGQFVGNEHEFDVKLFVFHALKHLVVPVKAAVEAIVGTPPQSFAKFSIVLPSLPDGPKESQCSAQRY